MALLSPPARLSDENLRAQAGAHRLRLKPSAKLRDTQLWARHTAFSRAPSPDPPPPEPPEPASFVSPPASSPPSVPSALLLDLAHGPRPAWDIPLPLPSSHPGPSSPPSPLEPPPPSPALLPLGRPASSALLRARISLQLALSTTPHARPSSAGPCPSSPPRPSSPPGDPALPAECSDHEAGLSPIKEDRTAELAAEHGALLPRASPPTRPTDLGLLPVPFSPSSPVQESEPSLRRQPSSASPRPCLQSATHPPCALRPARGPAIQDESSAPPETGAETLSASGHLPCRPPPVPTRSATMDDEHTPHRDLGAVSQPDESGSQSPVSAPTAVLSPEKSGISHAASSAESPSPRRQVLPPSARAGSFHAACPPLSVPANARRPLPPDLLCRLEMEEWRDHTGIDDRYALSFHSHGSSGIGERRAVGIGGEDCRGMKDRWGNTWGLESHVLSPLSEHTERSLTTVASVISLSTRQSLHSLCSLRSMESPSSNSLAQRLNQAEINSARMAKLGSGLLPSGVRAGTSRSVSLPLSHPGSPMQLNEAQVPAEAKEPYSLLEERMKRKEARRIRREKREKRRIEELRRSETLAEKQERRRQEKRKKEQFLARKHTLLQQLQDDPDNPALVRDLGILYFSCNAGVAGLKLAIRHLEASLQMSDTDPMAWSCLGKAWAKLRDMPEEELAKLGDGQESDRHQQSHNATIGLRKAILNSRTALEAITHKIEWARYLERLDRWRDSLSVMAEVIANEGKTYFRSWATLGFIGLRIVFGRAPLIELETEDFSQGFVPGRPSAMLVDDGTNEKLTDGDRLKLLVQVRHAFEKALELLVGETDLAHNQGTKRQEVRRYQEHYTYQLQRVRQAEQQMRVQGVGGPCESLASEDVCCDSEGVAGFDSASKVCSRSLAQSDVGSPVHSANGEAFRRETRSPSPPKSPRPPSTIIEPDLRPEEGRCDTRQHADLSKSISEDGSLKQVMDPDPTHHRDTSFGGSTSPCEVGLGSRGEGVERTRSELRAQKADEDVPQKVVNQAPSPPHLHLQPAQVAVDPEFCSESDLVLQYDDVDTTNDMSDDRMAGSWAGAHPAHPVHHSNYAISHGAQDLPPHLSLRRTASVLELGPVSAPPETHPDFRNAPGPVSNHRGHGTLPPALSIGMCTDVRPESTSEAGRDVLWSDSREYFTPASSARPHGTTSASLHSLKVPSTPLLSKPPLNQREWQPTSPAPPGAWRGSGVSQAECQTQTPGSSTTGRAWMMEQAPSVCDDTVHDGKRNRSLLQAGPRGGGELEAAMEMQRQQLKESPTGHFHEKMLAVLELDTKFFNEKRLLNKQMLEMEEEHERRRQEMIEELGMWLPSNGRGKEHLGSPGVGANGGPKGSHLGLMPLDSSLMSMACSGAAEANPASQCRERDRQHWSRSSMRRLNNSRSRISGTYHQHRSSTTTDRGRSFELPDHGSSGRANDDRPDFRISATTGLRASSLGSRECVGNVSMESEVPPANGHANIALQGIAAILRLAAGNDSGSNL